MVKEVDKREFSRVMRDVNSAFIALDEEKCKTIRVGFVLLEHFSMMAFTAAMDTLVTTNLVRSAPLFTMSTFGLYSSSVKSDLNLNISTDFTIEDLIIDDYVSMDAIIICGGYRSSLNESVHLSAKLKLLDKKNIVLGGLWNGAVALAHTGLLNHKACSVHIDNHAFIKEHFPYIYLSEYVFKIDGNYMTCADPNSALEMMCVFIESCFGRDTVRAIREILMCNQVENNNEATLMKAADNPAFPDTLRNILQLIKSNIEEPLQPHEISSYVGLSRRYIERLFQTHLATTPSRYYLELRITHARRLLLQSNDLIGNIAVASGFHSTTHFNHCFKAYFGLSPSQIRKKYRSDPF
ncbi:helix-turn-helix domain-containing protein [Shewanella psychropiezotolerans]|uniref:Helix-turn-helix domain-containing protein n=1 Tax=Shewanella psychropiezotolerans TaxID=2593655 RepID=A0ABX5WXW0_9GAMM|nr:MULTISPECIES: helix-turn-helix domain-containing protein [Shewanella]MPY24650.1 helix-turn-helix domain-containing protein [Shewanella sp. YLB-07]QDO83935.1 helix-turn-helix domain-containing protein [Shewanella psychropiezotolerans]